MLPIGPEFEPERNMPPFVVREEPPVGSIIRDPNQVFQVTVEDPNRLDDLHIRWLIDYPPFNENITKTGLAIPVGRSGPDKPNQHVLPFKPECVHLISPTLSQHSLLLVISDRPFVDDTVGPAANASWTRSAPARSGCRSAGRSRRSAHDGDHDRQRTVARAGGDRAGAGRPGRRLRRLR